MKIYKKKPSSYISKKKTKERVQEKNAVEVRKKNVQEKQTRIHKSYNEKSFS